jgi:ubiquinone/menaquinone biosynthesis C-methylase UbiE
MLAVRKKKLYVNNVREENLSLRAKYNITAMFYDMLDYPWERVYREWRPRLLGDLRGKVLEAGVGTERNFSHYHESVELKGVDLSDVMLGKAARKAMKARCKIELLHDDASVMHLVGSDQYDWIISTFLCCVMPDELQPMALVQFGRVLKPGGKFRLLEMIYSKDSKIRRRQEFFTAFVEKVYGARFDRKTVQYIEESAELDITSTRFLKDDVYLLIEGVRKG